MDPLLKVGLTKEDLDIPVTERDRKRMHASTPHGGRYANYTEPLEGITSEFQLVKRRLDIEVEYLIALGDEFQNYKGTRKKLIEYPFGDRERDALRRLYTNFSEQDYVRFKKIERQTDHDVVAMIVLGLYNMGDVIDPELMERALHFGRTSSDMDSNVFSLVMQEILATYYLPAISGLQNMFIGKSKEWHEIPEEIKKEYARPFTVIVGQTHEQPAVPTPLKKVVANIASAIDQGISRLVISGPKGDKPFRLYGKLGGAVGNDESMISAYPDHDWQPFYRKFIEGLDLEYQPVCDQDESNMKLLDLLGIIKKNEPASSEMVR